MIINDYHRSGVYFGESIHSTKINLYGNFLPAISQNFDHFGFCVGEVFVLIGSIMYNKVDSNRCLLLHAQTP